MHIYDPYLIDFVKIMDSACNVREGSEEEERMKRQALYSIRGYSGTEI